MQASRWFGLAARAAFGVFAAAGLTSCGSGAVSGPVAVNDPAKITVLPSSATLYSGLPTTFTITGGTGSYIVGSSNQSIVPVSGAIAGSTLTIIPNDVAADTTVTLNVRDTGSTPPVSADLTVKPGTVSNNLTITPSSTQGLSCAPAVCSGGDAAVTVKLQRAGQPLSFHAVRFEALSGDFRFITSSPQASIEVTDLTTTVLTDANGNATARIRVLPGAANQTALVRVVDVDSGAFQTASFTIAQATATSPGFFASPSSVAFTGPNNQSCASNVNATIGLFGGTPPYNVASGGSAFAVSPTVLGSSGATFSITPTGICSGGTTITIADAAGRTTTVTASNALGAVSIPDLVVSPTRVALTSCTAVATVSIGGGTGQYTASVSNNAINATVSGNAITIRRTPNTIAPTTTTVGIASGSAVASVTVDMQGAAIATSCPPGTF